MIGQGGDRHHSVAWLTAAIRFVRYAEARLAGVAAGMLLATMLIVSADVFMRYLLNQPFAWSYDLVSLYLLPGLFYLSLSTTFSVNGHIAVDVIQDRLSVAPRRVCQVLTGLMLAGLFSTIALVCGERAWADFETSAVAAGAISWPTWCTYALAAAGSGMLVAGSVVHSIAHTVALAGGPELIPLAHIAGTGERGFE